MPIVRDLLAFGAAGAHRISVCVADPFAVSNRGHRRARRLVTDLGGRDVPGQTTERALPAVVRQPLLQHSEDY